MSQHPRVPGACIYCTARSAQCTTFFSCRRGAWPPPRAGRRGRPRTVAGTPTSSRAMSQTAEPSSVSSTLGERGGWRGEAHSARTPFRPSLGYPGDMHGYPPSPSSSTKSPHHHGPFSVEDGEPLGSCHWAPTDAPGSGKTPLWRRQLAGAAVKGCAGAASSAHSICEGARQRGSAMLGAPHQHSRQMKQQQTAPAVGCSDGTVHRFT